jgi:hypothetical protein
MMLQHKIWNGEDSFAQEFYNPFYDASQSNVSYLQTATFRPLS